MARIRVIRKQKFKIKEEELHTLIDETGDKDNEYEKVKPNVAYGQTRNLKQFWSESPPSIGI